MYRQKGFASERPCKRNTLPEVKETWFSQGALHNSMLGLEAIWILRFGNHGFAPWNVMERDIAILIPQTESISCPFQENSGNHTVVGFDPA